MITDFSLETAGTIVAASYNFYAPGQMTDIFDTKIGAYKYSIFWDGFEGNLKIGTKNQFHTVSLHAECPPTGAEDVTFATADGLLIDETVVPFKTPLQTDCQLDGEMGGIHLHSFERYVFNPTNQTVTLELHSEDLQLHRVRKYIVVIDATNVTPSGIQITEAAENP